jgi:hypothetical protein
MLSLLAAALNNAAQSALVMLDVGLYVSNFTTNNNA